MKWIALVVVVVGLAGCAGLRVAQWRPEDMRGAVAAPLCSLCSEPYDYQQQAAAQKMAALCGPRQAKLVEVGTSLSSNVQAWAVPIAGGGAVAGASQGVDYYWAFKCVTPPSP